MFLSCGFCPDAVRIVLVGTKVALWFRLARACAGVCSVLSRNRPRIRSFKKSRPFSCSSFWYMFPLLSGSFGKCPGVHSVLLSMIRCNALGSVWAFGRNSIVLKEPPCVMNVIAAPFIFLLCCIVELRSE